jgi:hypothetical protein
LPPITSLRVVVVANAITLENHDIHSFAAVVVSLNQMPPKYTVRMMVITSSLPSINYALVIYLDTNLPPVSP